MKKVVNVNLGGNAYQLEEDGFDCLTDYLENARLRLKGNPDLEEIMADLEQSIADKMSRFLSAKKTVVSTAEVEQIIEEMGPVDSAEEDAAAPGRESSTPDDQYDDETVERKLYKLTGSEKMLTGVCAGIAAYFGIDVTIVRIIFVALTFASGGLVILFYIALALIVPSADTPQQHAAAYGIPFDAREVIDRVRSKFDDMRSGKRWKSHERNLNRHARNAGFDGIGPLLGLVIVLFGILIGLWLLSRLILFFGVGPNMGMYYPSGMPWWAAALMVIGAVYLIGWIFRGSSEDDREGLGSFLVKTIKVFLILIVVYVAFRLLFGVVAAPINTLVHMTHSIF